MSYENACANPKCEYHEFGVRHGDHEFYMRSDPNGDPKKVLRVRMANGQMRREIWFCERCAAGVKAFLNA